MTGFFHRLTSHFNPFHPRRSKTSRSRSRERSVRRLFVEPLEDRNLPSGYYLLPLGTLPGGSFSYATDLNSHGHVVGYSEVERNGALECHAFLRRDGAMIDLGTLGGGWSGAWAVNDLGQVLGSADTADGVSHDFLLTPTDADGDGDLDWNHDANGDGTNDLMRMLPEGFDGRDINNAGQVVGWTSAGAAVWDESNGFTHIGQLGWPPPAINDAGQVSGSSWMPDGSHHATLWDSAHGMSDLGTTAGFANSRASGISGYGHVAGHQWNPPADPDVQRVQKSAFLWTPDSSNATTGTLVDLGRPGNAIDLWTYDVNSYRELVGSAEVEEPVYCEPWYDCDPSYSWHAVAWTPGSGWIDLNVATNSWGLEEAVAINDAGQIAVNGYVTVWNGSWITGQFPVLLSPIPSTTITLSDATVVEGNTGAAAAVFTATLSAPSERTVSVSYATADGTATAADGDYQPASGTLTFAPGETQKTITVLVNGDRRAEPHESFYVNLGNPIHVTVTDWQAVGVIQDDEPRVSIGDVSLAEGNTGTTLAVFTVTLTAASDQPVSVDYATADGSAMSADNDYQTAAGTVVFAPGEISKTISVLINGDRRAEPTEGFYVNLSNAANALLADPEAIGFIGDDEPRISIGDVSKREGRKGKTQFVFTVTLSAAYDQAVTVTFRTLDGTAKAAEDYVAKTGTLTFNPGETTKTIVIDVIGDTRREADETFNVELFGAGSNALLADWWALGTILNDD